MNYKQHFSKFSFREAVPDSSSNGHDTTRLRLISGRHLRMKDSGIGAGGSEFGIEEFLEVNYLCLGGIDPPSRGFVPGAI